MTAPDPRVGEIQAAEALVHVKCLDCAKCRIAEEDCWCPECEYWGCEQGPDCENDAAPTDVAYLLAELRDRDEKLASIRDGVIREIEEVSSSPYADEQFTSGWRMALELIRDRVIRAAVAAANGVGDTAPLATGFPPRPLLKKGTVG